MPSAGSLVTCFVHHLLAVGTLGAALLGSVLTSRVPPPPSGLGCTSGRPPAPGEGERLKPPGYWRAFCERAAAGSGIRGGPGVAEGWTCRAANEFVA